MWRGCCSREIKAAALVVAMFLATPYAWDYDMVVLIFAAAWLVKDISASGAHAWERLVVAGLMLLPLVMAPLTRLTGLQIGPIVLWVVLIFVVLRALGRVSAVAPDVAP